MIYEILRREAAELLSIEGEGNGRLAQQRGTAAAGVNDWQTVVREFAAACQAPGSDSICWMVAGSNYLITGDQAAYRDHCRQMFKRFSGSSVFVDFERAALTATVVPGALPAGDMTIEEVSKAMDAAEGTQLHRESYREWYLVGRSLVRYRAGNWKAAADDAEKALALKPTAFTVRPLAGTIAALAYHQLGDVATAKERLAGAAKDRGEWAAYRTPDGLADYARLARGDYFWHDSLFADLLYAEAKALIEGTPPAGTEAKTSPN